MERLQYSWISQSTYPFVNKTFFRFIDVLFIKILISLDFSQNINSIVSKDNCLSYRAVCFRHFCLLERFHLTLFDIFRPFYHYNHYITQDERLLLSLLPIRGELSTPIFRLRLVNEFLKSQKSYPEPVEPNQKPTRKQHGEILQR